MFGHDPEAYIQDADLEMMELERVGTIISRLNRKGICTHEGSGPGDAPGSRKCGDCGTQFPSSEAHWAARDAILASYL